MDFNYRVLLKISSLVVCVTGIGMIPSVICAAIYEEYTCLKDFLICSICFSLIGFLIYRYIPVKQRNLRARDGYLIVASCWIISCLLGAIPYMFSGHDLSFSQCLFESTAGFTTTGTTVLDGEIVSKSLLLYKAVTHWLGGMGILILAVSILPALGIGGQALARAETPAPKVDKLSNRISDSSRILYIMYFGLTILEFILLALSDSISDFDALVNTLSTISTGGIMTHSSGLAYYNSPYIEIVITVFTISAAINFNLYFFLLHGKIKDFFSNAELRIFLYIIGVVTVLITLNLLYFNVYDSFGETLRHAFTQVVSFISTSGFTFASYMDWPVFSKVLLISLIFIGGCAASTSGGIKVIRILVMMKLIFRGFLRRIHPRSVVAVKIKGKAVSGPMVTQISTFILVYFFIFVVSSILLSLDGLDFETTTSTVAGIMSNSGIGMGQFGEVGNLSMFSTPAQFYLSFLMILGRLELFTILFLFVPSFWNPSRQKN